ncbi:MAG: DUF4280 domain-containing protein [Alphaproteobacteria bacterium]|nr:DUF4280 domain-containing protein [Alphaproteobacteria bacterium]
MGMQTTCVALCKCSFGSMPVPMIVLPSTVNVFSLPAGTTSDNLPFANILPFGMCQSMGNPMVIAATVAALGVMTPMPCIPMTFSPWSPPSPTVQICGKQALNNGAKLNCIWGGMIEIKFPGQVTVMIP